MAQPWHVIASAPTPDGTLELRRRGDSDFLITLGGLILMNSSARASEMALAGLACGHLRRAARPRVLVSGLGMGYTLRVVLDSLPRSGEVTVAELNPVIVEWCRGPLAAATGRAVEDPRVRVEVADVAGVIGRAASGETPPYDAIVLDLYEGPHARTRAQDDPFYGTRALETTRAALGPGGVFAVWGENADAGFVKRLKAAGFSVATERPGHGGLRHVVYVARVAATRGRPSGASRDGGGRKRDDPGRASSGRHSRDASSVRR